METSFTGRVWVLGDDIDTDIIIPTEYLALKTIDDMKQYGFCPLRPGAGRSRSGKAISSLPVRTSAAVPPESRRRRSSKHWESSVSSPNPSRGSFSAIPSTTAFCSSSSRSFYDDM